jgi:branched-subunit amino acid transport protein
MIEIGHRHQGTALVNATAVLVLSYTVGAMLSPALGAAALQWAPEWGFPALLAGVAATALAALSRR